MPNDLGSVVRALAETINTGSVPGKPNAPYVLRTMTGTITSISSSACTVAFAGSTIAGLRFMLTGRTLVVGDVVLVLQLPHQRLVLGAISH